MSSVKEIIAQVDRLPAMPAVVQRALALLSNPDFSFQELMDIMVMDPALTVQVLRVANSPYYGLLREVTSLEQAMTYLGAEAVTQIILSTQVLGYYRVGQEGYRLNRGELWRHSMGTALLARKIGEKTGFKDKAGLFTAALLHDVGKLVLSEYVGDRFLEIERQVREDGKSFLAAERDVLGIDHAVLGGLVVRKWNLPESIVTAVAFHHYPHRAASHREMANLVALANLMCVTFGVSGGAEGLASDMPPGLLEEVGLPNDEYVMLTLELKDIIDQADDVLSLAD